jgi:hypothetical protein
LPSLLNGSLTPDTQPCVRYDLAGTKAATFLTMPTPAVNALAAKTGQHVAGTTVDQVAIPAGSGVLARDLPTPGANPGTEFLVTDFGVKFPLAAGASAALGYAAGSGVDVPNQLLALLPTGPVLSSTAALAEGTP